MDSIWFDATGIRPGFELPAIHPTVANPTTWICLRLDISDAGRDGQNLAIGKTGGLVHSTL